jgi:hypothetical protein
MRIIKLCGFNIKDKRYPDGDIFIKEKIWEKVKKFKKINP